MRFLADANLPVALVEMLRSAGHNVLAANEDLPNASDEFLVERAIHDERVLITQDKDFGQLVFGQKRAGNYGVILFRIAKIGRKAESDRMFLTVTSSEDWLGHLSVVTDSGIRILRIR